MAIIANQGIVSFIAKIITRKIFKIFKKSFRKIVVILLVATGFLSFSDRIIAQIQNLYEPINDQFAGISTLMSAVVSGDVDGVKFFSKGGALVINQRNKGGASALHLACRQGDFPIAKILIDNGANLNIADNEGWTPLMRASLAGNQEIVKYLLDKGANAEATNLQNESVIIHATSSKCLECLNHIIESGNLIKKMDTTFLKSQIADAFLIARNQENPQIQGVLESFLDYISRSAPLIKKDNKSYLLPIIPNQNSLSEPSISNPTNSRPWLNKSSRKYMLKNSEGQDLSGDENQLLNNSYLPILAPITKPITSSDLPSLNSPNSTKIYKFKKIEDNSSKIPNKNSPQSLRNQGNSSVGDSLINSPTNPSQLNSKVKIFKLKIGKSPESYSLPDITPNPAKEDSKTIFNAPNQSSEKSIAPTKDAIKKQYFLKKETPALENEDKEGEGASSIKVNSPKSKPELKPKLQLEPKLESKLESESNESKPHFIQKDSSQELSAEVKILNKKSSKKLKTLDNQPQQDIAPKNIEDKNLKLDSSKATLPTKKSINKKFKLIANENKEDIAKPIDNQQENFKDSTSINTAKPSDENSASSTNSSEENKTIYKYKINQSSSTNQDI